MRRSRLGGRGPPSACGELPWEDNICQCSLADDGFIRTLPDDTEKPTADAPLTAERLLFDRDARAKPSRGQSSWAWLHLVLRTYDQLLTYLGLEGKSATSVDTLWLAMVHVLWYYLTTPRVWLCRS